MRPLLATLVCLACSSPAKPAPVGPVTTPPDAAAGEPVDQDPSPEAIAALQTLHDARFDEKRVSLAISILARQSRGLPPLLEVVARRPTASLQPVQAHAIRELGKRAASEPSDRAAIVQALLAVVSRPLAELAADPGAAKKLYVLLAGPAFEALADLHVAEVVEPALVAMMRHPPLFAFVKRALIAAGPTAKAAVVRVLRGEHAELERVIASEQLDRSCPPKGACVMLANRDHYAAHVLGHFYDPATAPELLAALQKPPLPYFLLDDGRPSEITQHHAIFEALRRIGASAAARPFEALWASRTTPPTTRVLAVASYPFVTADPTAVKKLAAIVRSPREPADLRREAAIAISRLSRDVADITTLRKLAAGSREYQLLYLAPIPRIAIVDKCKTDLACYAAAERMTPVELAALVRAHMPEVDTLEPLEREELSIIAIDRAVFELRRAGAAAAPFTDVLLELASSDRRELRHFGSLALPRVAPTPCPMCVRALDRAIESSKQLDAAYDLTLLRDHFFWSGKTP